MSTASATSPIVKSRPSTRRARRGRVPLPVAIALLPALFGLALLAPMPALPNEARAQVVASVEDRLPGWQIVRTRSSWEGAWTVVAACGASRLGFQWVPGHGLPPGGAWLHPADPYARNRLAATSDDYRFLVWLREARRPRVLSCSAELARTGILHGRVPLN
jgi:hypothetical protein